MLVKLRYKLRKRQVKILDKFARAMKWPNLEETLDKLRQGNADATVDGVSSDAMAFFSGLVLPGVSPFPPTRPFSQRSEGDDADDGSRRTPSSS